MAIKRVVDKTKSKVVKRFPEFNINKLYIVECSDRLYKIVQNNNKFQLIVLTKSYSACSEYDTFEALLEVRARNKTTVYILDTENDIARFIMGCREFPIVQEIEETINESFTDDEVSIEDVAKDKIYGLLCNYDKTICKIHQDKDDYYWYSVSLDDLNVFAGYASYLEDLIRENIAEGDPVYQFDTQEEFLRWSLEQVTGKKFDVVPAKGGIIGQGYQLYNYTDKAVEVLC
jgi:hypothetical protein